MWANLKATGTWPNDRDRLKSSVRNGEITSTAALSVWFVVSQVCTIYSGELSQQPPLHPS